MPSLGRNTFIVQMNKAGRNNKKKNLVFNLILHWLQRKGFGGIIQKLDCGLIPKKLNSVPIKNIQENQRRFLWVSPSLLSRIFFKYLVNNKMEGCVRVRN